MTPQENQLLQQGMAAHRAGNFAAAEQCYRQMLQLAPQQPDAWHLLGTLALQRGQYEQAREQIARAIAIEPRAAPYHSNLGTVYDSLGRFDEAEQSYRRAIELAPSFGDAQYNLGRLLVRRKAYGEAILHLETALRLTPNSAGALNNLGLALRETGRLEEAAARLLRAIQIDPALAEAHSNLGIVYRQQRRLAEARAYHEQALRIRPQNFEAHFSLANTLRQMRAWDEAAAHYREVLRLRPGDADAWLALGQTCKELGRLDEAIDCYQQAVNMRPDDATAYQSLGFALVRLGRAEDAEAILRRALELKPDDSLLLTNLAAALEQQGQLDAAGDCCRRAIALKPDLAAAAHSNLGLVLRQQGRINEAAASCRTALELDPDMAEPHGHLSFVKLLRGELEAGFAEYELRRGWMKYPPGSYPQPQWDGSPLAGRTILLHSEQGLGDTLQFIRYAPRVKALGANVLVMCPQTLTGLLAGVKGVDSILLPDNPLPAFDVHAPLMSLPYIFRTTLETIPAEVPYLAADAAAAALWRSELDAMPGLKVGICWAGNPQHPADRWRSLPLAQFAPLAKLPGVKLYSLQKGPGSEQLQESGGNLPIEDWGPRLPDMSTAAAAVASLDLVIACDTALVHLAGALAKPVWIALPYAPDWRWLLERRDSPWYPTARLFRQRAWGQWSAVFDEIAESLVHRATEQRTR